MIPRLPLLAVFLLLSVWAAAAGRAQPPSSSVDHPLLVAQKRPHDRGNCFQWKGCRGDSLGQMWVHAPEFCAILGGRSWMDQNGRCHNLPDGPRATEAP